RGRHLVAGERAGAPPGAGFRGIRTATTVSFRQRAGGHRRDGPSGAGGVAGVAETVGGEGYRGASGGESRGGAPTVLETSGGGDERHRAAENGDARPSADAGGPDALRAGLSGIVFGAVDGLVGGSARVDPRRHASPTGRAGGPRGDAVVGADGG